MQTPVCIKTCVSSDAVVLALTLIVVDGGGVVVAVGVVITVIICLVLVIVVGDEKVHLLVDIGHTSNKQHIRAWD